MNQPQKSLDGQFASDRTWLASFCFGIMKVLVLHEVGAKGPDAVSFTEDANAEQILKSSLLAGFKVTEHSFHQCPHWQPESGDEIKELHFWRRWTLINKLPKSGYFSLGNQRFLIHFDNFLASEIGMPTSWKVVLARPSRVIGENQRWPRNQRKYIGNPHLCW